jgi:hypothetical protein
VCVCVRVAAVDEVLTRGFLAQRSTHTHNLSHCLYSSAAAPVFAQAQIAVELTRISGIVRSGATGYAVNTSVTPTGWRNAWGISVTTPFAVSQPPLVFPSLWLRIRGSEGGVGGGTCLCQSVLDACARTDKRDCVANMHVITCDYRVIRGSLSVKLAACVGWHVHLNDFSISYTVALAQHDVRVHVSHAPTPTTATLLFLIYFLRLAAPQHDWCAVHRTRSQRGVGGAQLVGGWIGC